MDRYWQEVADFLAERRLAGRRTVAPVEFSPAVAVDIGYRNTEPSDGSQVSVLVLHKGLYQELDRRFLSQAIRRLRPVFANEVFVVFADEGDELPDSNPDLDPLRGIESWAVSEEEMAG